ncbi:MAG: relaxase/mobilization nuclease domain-containing protein, partial [Bacteroidales bacterium]|nr:relaxase/mobilization nuclease domain-containing protein [Bacteroidales bacterium]
MERKRFSVLFYTKKSKLLRNGEAPLRVRITYDKQYVEMQLKCSIPSELWSQPKERATGRDRKSNDLNYYIDSLRVQFFRIFQEMDLEGKIISPRAIVNHYQGKDDHAKTLYGVFKEHNDNCRKLISVNNDYKRNIAVCKKLKDRYQLTYGKGKVRVNRPKRYGADKAKYAVCDAMKEVLPKSADYQMLAENLKPHGITIQFKCRRGTDIIEGVSFEKDDYTFKGSQIDRKFSHKNLMRMFAI